MPNPSDAEAAKELKGACAGLQDSPSASVGGTLQRGPTLLVNVDSTASTRKPSAKERRLSMSSIGNLSNAAGQETCCPTTVTAIVRSPNFECAVAVVILMNCATMGVEAQVFIKGGHSVVSEVAEHMFTALFLIELLVRIGVYGWRRFVPCCGGWWSDLLDAIVVLITGVVPIWVLPLVTIPGSASTNMLRTLTVLRALRLVRLVRVVKVAWFQEVWLLLRGMIESMRMLFWTVVVIAFITYIFAIFGVVLISVDIRDALYQATQDGDEGQIEHLAYLYESFDGVDSFMFTLVQVLTLDSWTGLVRQAMKYNSWCWIFFYMYVSLAVLVLMNIVTAVLVDHALMNSKKDADEVVAAKEREKRHALKQFKILFESMDADGSGDLTREEFSEAFAQPEIASKLKALDIQPEDCEEIFNMLDSGDGVLSLEEFFEGLQRMEGTATAKDLFRVLKKTEFLQTKLRSQSSREQMAKGVISAQSSPSASQGASPLAGATWDGATGHATQPGSAAMMQRMDAVVLAVGACNAKVDQCLREIRGAGPSSIV